MLIVGGVACSAAAQLLLKGAAGAAPFGARWLLWMVGGAITYVAAFAMYAAILRIYPISTASPVMTVAVMCTVVFAGALLGEPMPVRRWCGVLLGIASIFAVLP